MSKEIREGMEYILQHNAGCTKIQSEWVTDALLRKLHSLGVVIKVDRELPGCMRCGNTGIVTEFKWIGPTGGNLDKRIGDRTRKQQYPCPDCERSKIRTGYEAVEPLIGVKLPQVVGRGGEANATD